MNRIIWMGLSCVISMAVAYSQAGDTKVSQANKQSVFGGGLCYQAWNDKNCPAQSGVPACEQVFCVGNQCPVGTKQTVAYQGTYQSGCFVDEQVGYGECNLSLMECESAELCSPNCILSFDSFVCVSDPNALPFQVPGSIVLQAIIDYQLGCSP